MRILIVEDEVRLAQALEEIFKSEKYIVDVVNDGEDGLFYASSDEYNVIILDVMLPKMNGFDVAKELRKSNINTPILMLTAKAEIPDKVEGLDMGADDYMTKPFSTQELLARVRALSRRQGEVEFEKLIYQDLTLNLSTHILYNGKKEIKLGYKEFEVLRILMHQAEKIVPKETLISKVWGFDSDAEDNNVEVYISFLRKKIEYLNSDVVIRTIRKVGYSLERNEE